MAYSYPIWNDVQACIYKGSKSWGAKNTCDVNVNVGSSATNSNLFVNHTTTRREINKDCIKDLQKVKEKSHIHIAGEGGEYESSVFDTPIFKKRIVIEESSINMENDYTGVLNINSAHLEDK